MAQLLAIVAVDFDKRVQCRQPGCGHSVYRQVHVVQDGPELLVLGSTCFAKRYGGSNALGGPSYGGGGGRQLTDAERELLANNTAALLAQFEAEAQEVERLRREAFSKQVPPPLVARPVESRPTPPTSSRSFSSPFPWAAPGRSMLYLHMQDGTGWIRVEHKDGQQRLVPWPKFEGWDETLPSSVGLADHELGCLHVRDIVSALIYLRQHAQWEKVVGSWRELNVLVSGRIKQ